MDQKLKNNVAVVTGAARGIGLAIGERLARDGAKLVVADMDGAELDRAAKHLGKEFDAEVVSRGGDLSSESVAKATIDLAVDRFGRLDVLVNNAGGGSIKALDEHTPEALRTTIYRNLWPVLWCSWPAGRDRYALSPVKTRGAERELATETVVVCGDEGGAEGENKNAALPDGPDVELYHVEAENYAAADMCTHGEASLSEEGILTGK